MPQVRNLRRAAVESIDRRLDQREAKTPKDGEVMALHGTSVDLRVRGSPHLWRNVPVRGNIAEISVGDWVSLHWTGRRPEVMSPGVSAVQAIATAENVSDHGSLSGLSDDDHTQYVTDERGDDRYFLLKTSESLLDQELMNIMFTTVSWAQFAVFEAFNDEAKRASPDPSPYPAKVGAGWLDNGDDHTPSRSFGFVSKTYNNVTTIVTGTSTDVGSGYLEDTTKNWYDTQYNNLVLIDSAQTEFTINNTVAATHRLEVTGTPAAGAYKIRTADGQYTVGLCTFLDSTNGGYGYTKLEASFNGGSHWMTIVDTEGDIDLRGGVLVIANQGRNYIVRVTLKNDGGGSGAIMYKFMVFSDPSVWVSME